MPSQSLAELHEQARANYVSWPLWLVMKRRQVEKLLAETASTVEDENIETSAEVDLLRQAKMPLPEDLSTFTLPSMVRLSGTRFTFVARIGDDHCALYFERQTETGQIETCDLLRVTVVNDWYVNYAAERLNVALETQPVDLVFNAAHLWVVFHGGGVLDAQWEVAQEGSVSEVHPEPAGTSWK